LESQTAIAVSANATFASASRRASLTPLVPMMPAMRTVTWL
jgi:hypothetical protein